MRRHIQMVERTVAKECWFSERYPAVTLGLTVHLETPGDPCVNLTTALIFDYDAAIAEEVQYRLDDRLYAGIAAGLAAAEPFPPEGLKVTLSGVRSAPSLARLLRDDRLFGLEIAGDYMQELAAEAVTTAWRQLTAPVPRDRDTA